MELGKLFFYMEQQCIADMLFDIFSIVFMVNRCFLYPFFIVFPVLKDVPKIDSSFLMQGVFFCLILLLVINFIWAVLILKMAMQLLKFGVLIDGDIRSVNTNSKNK
ncbi:Ceramide synthase 2 [Gurleya vavrai]